MPPMGVIYRPASGTFPVEHVNTSGCSRRVTEHCCPSPLKLGHYFGMERGFVMARKRHSDEDILKLLREIEVKLSAGSNVQSACRGVGISDATYYNWRKRFGGMGRSQLSEMRSLEKENTRLKKIVAELELDKLILKESLTYLKPRA
jgi:putative transposase